MKFISKLFKSNSMRVVMFTSLLGGLSDGQTTAVSVNIKEFDGVINDPVEPYGVVPASNWINSIKGNFFSHLKNTDGDTTSVNISMGTKAAMTYQFGGVLDNTPMRAGHSVQPGETREILLSGLSGTFSTYDVIVYVAGFSDAGNTATLTIGGTTYYCKVPSPFDGSLIRSIDTVDDVVDDEGTYVRFEGLTGDSQTLVMEAQNGAIGIGGIQIVGEEVDSLPVSGPVSLSWKEFFQTINDPSEPAGVISGSFWNNVVGGASPTNLLTSGGGASTIDLVTQASAGLGTFFNSALDNSVLRSGVESFNADAGAEITLSDINATYDAYDVILYVTGFNGGENQGSVSDGTTTYYFEVPNPYVADFIQSTDTDLSDGSDTGTYVRFDGLTQDSVTFSLRSTNALGVAIGGIQIVESGAASNDFSIVSVSHSGDTDEINIEFSSRNGVIYSVFGGTDFSNVSEWSEVSSSELVGNGGNLTFSFATGEPSFFLQVRED